MVMLLLTIRIAPYNPHGPIYGGPIFRVTSLYIYSVRCSYEYGMSTIQVHVYAIHENIVCIVQLPAWIHEICFLLYVHLSFLTLHQYLLISKRP